VTQDEEPFSNAEFLGIGDAPDLGETALALSVGHWLLS
jgi:hypothetical protein